MHLVVSRQTVRTARQAAKYASSGHSFRIQAMTEETLLERIANGDSAAVSEFVARYGGLVWSIARRFTRTESDAEDAVQEIFLDMWKSAKSYRREIAAEKTFVTMIARRRLIDRIRKKTLQTDGSIEVDTLVGFREDVSAKAELTEEAAIAASFLDELPAEQSRSIRLAVYDGLSHSQIAELTGISLGTVKTQIRRGILKLRERLKSRLSWSQEGVQ